MRQTYETDADRKAEMEIAQIVVDRWSLSRAEPLNPLAYGFDYALIRGERDVTAFAEIKCRDGSNGNNGLEMGYGDGYYLALQKVMKAKMLGKPGFLVVKFKGGEIGYWRLEQTTAGQLIWAGRGKPRDVYDREPHVIFAWGDLRILPA